MTRPPDFEETMREHEHALYRVVRSYAPPGAEREDLAQEVALAVFRALPMFRGDSSVKTFLLRVAHLRGVSYLAKRRAARGRAALEIDLEGLADPGAPADMRASSREDLERLFAAIRRLPIPSRQVLAFALEGLSHAEIAGAVGTSVENVAVRLSRARSTLRKELES